MRRVITGRLPVADLDAMEQGAAVDRLLEVCSSPAWAEAVVAGRPYGDAGTLLAAAGTALARLGDRDVLAALAGHPRIGAPVEGESAREQGAVGAAAEDVRAALAEGNRTYERRFGHVYLVRAAGREPDELLALLRRRLDNDPATEWSVVRRELAEITRLRLERMVLP